MKYHGYNYENTITLHNQQSAKGTLNRVSSDTTKYKTGANIQ